MRVLCFDELIESRAHVEEPIGTGTRHLGIKGGVLVTRITGEPAAGTELRPGDVIVAVNNREVAGVAAFNELVGTLPAGKWVPLLVNRGGNPQYIPIQVPTGK